MNRATLVYHLLKMKTEAADYAVYLLSVADDAFSKVHATCHAQAVRQGEVCNCGVVTRSHRGRT